MHTTLQETRTSYQNIHSFPPSRTLNRYAQTTPSTNSPQPNPQPATMAQFFPQQPYAPPSAQNLQFYPSQYPPQPPVSGHTTPAQAQYGGYGAPPNQAYSSQGFGTASSSAFTSGGPSSFGGAGFGPPGGGVSGRMGEQGGLRTGWLAAFGTEGYEGEPALLEELGVNFGHIKGKVGACFCLSCHFWGGFTIPVSPFTCTGKFPWNRISNTCSE